MSPLVPRSELEELVGHSLSYARRVLWAHFSISPRVCTVVRPGAVPGTVLAASATGALVEEVWLEVAGADPLDAFSPSWGLRGAAAGQVRELLDRLSQASVAVVADYLDALGEAVHPLTTADPTALAAAAGVGDWRDGEAGSRTGLLGLVALDRGQAEAWQELCRRLLGLEGELRRPGTWAPWVLGRARAGEVVAVEAEAAREPVVLDVEAGVGVGRTAVELAATWSEPRPVHLVTSVQPTSSPAAVAGEASLGGAVACAPIAGWNQEPPWVAPAAASSTGRPSTPPSSG